MERLKEKIVNSGLDSNLIGILLEIIDEKKASNEEIDNVYSGLMDELVYAVGKQLADSNLSGTECIRMRDSLEKEFENLFYAYFGLRM